jgi:hypothetical protein
MAQKVPVARSQAGSAGWRGDPRITVGAVPTTATLIDAERARLGDVTECRSSHAMTFLRETSAATSFLLRGSGNGSTFGNGCIIGGAAGDTASEPGEASPSDRRLLGVVVWLVTGVIGVPTKTISPTPDSTVAAKGART